MNLTDEQKQALNTLSVGTAVVRLADEHPEPFLVRVPRCPVAEGSISDYAVRTRMAGYLADSAPTGPASCALPPITPIPPADRYEENESHPPSPYEEPLQDPESPSDTPDPAELGPQEQPPEAEPQMSREAVRFVADVATRPLSTTVSRYQRLHLSRRKGNAIRQDLSRAGLIEAVAIPTRSGQVMLYQLTDGGRAVCTDVGVDAGPAPRVSLEHRYWAGRAADMFADRGFEVTHEYAVQGNGTVDVLAERPGERIAIEIETGKSDIANNIAKLAPAGFDRIILVATSPTAVTACQAAIAKADADVELLTWLDLS